MIRRIVDGILAQLPKRLLETIAEAECRISRAWVASAHRRLMHIQWALPPQPEHFDHHIDLYYQFLSTRNPMWLERGAFGSLVLQGGQVLELACGDGFNARNFYSLLATKVVACDYDPNAIATAKAKNHCENVDFILADIRTTMPSGRFDNVVWDAAIEHFTPDEIRKILKDIKSRLSPTGILNGYTIVEKADGKQLDHHEYEFQDKQDLLGLLAAHFQHVTVFETIDPNRHNLYFWASDADLPFRERWAKSVTERALHAPGIT